MDIIVDTDITISNEEGTITEVVPSPIIDNKKEDDDITFLKTQPLLRGYNKTFKEHVYTEAKFRKNNNPTLLIFEKYCKELKRLINQDVYAILSNSEGHYYQYISVNAAFITGNFEIANFTMNTFPGNCGIAISYNHNTPNAYLNKKIGTLLMQLKKEYAKALGFSILMLTNTSYSNYHNQLCNNAGFKTIHSFMNKRSGNQCSIKIVEL